MGTVGCHVSRYCLGPGERHTSAQSRQVWKETRRCARVGVAYLFLLIPILFKMFFVPLRAIIWRFYLRFSTFGRTLNKVSIRGPGHYGVWSTGMGHLR